MAVKRKFSGIWMPAALWEFEGLNISERCFIAEIDSLDHGDGCWAKNEHFSRLFGLSKNRCSEIISRLAEKGFLEVVRDDEGTRFLRVTLGFEISNPPSESRLTPSESRLTPSESRLPIYKDRDKHIDKQERDARAIDFLKLNYPSRFESWEMKNKSLLPDLEIFYRMFDNKVDTEGLVFSDKILFARLDTYFLNWTRNNNQRTNSETVISHPSLKRIS